MANSARQVPAGPALPCPALTLTSAPGGHTAYVGADLRSPVAILTQVAALETLDFSRPIGLMLIGISHFVPDETSPPQIMATLLDSQQFTDLAFRNLEVIDPGIVWCPTGVLSPATPSPIPPRSASTP